MYPARPRGQLSPLAQALGHASVVPTASEPPHPNNNNTSKKTRASTESLLPGSVEHRSARKHRCTVGVNGRLRVRLYSIQHLLWIFRAFVLCLVVGVRADLSCLPMSGYGLRTSQTANQVQRRGEGKRHLEGPRGGGEGGVSRVYGTAEARVTGAVGSRRPLEDAAASDAGTRSRAKSGAAVAPHATHLGGEL